MPIKLLKKKTVAQEPQEDFLPNALRIAACADQYKAMDIRAYDVRGLTMLADVFLVCHAASEPQMRAISHAVVDGLKEIGIRPLHEEGTFHGGWMILDYGSVIVHIFREEARAFYDLDGFWADAPLLALGLDA